MEKVLKLYKYVNGVNDTPFAEHIVISSFRYDAKRMGGAPVITCSAMSELCLDKLWDYDVYAPFNGEKYFIKHIPTSSYDNGDSRYKHELELVSERAILDNVYVHDVVDSESEQDKPVSNSSNFSFFGDISEFANRLNQSLKYSKVGYSVVVDEGITSEAKMVSFKDQFFSNAIQESYNTYNIPYYFVGKEIHFGYSSNVITHTFKYGINDSLLSIQKSNANYRIVNRITGVGSEDNIPYYYPNDFESKAEVEAHGGTWINPCKNLMPSIYRETLGKERFYNATEDFSNPFIEGHPKEHIVNFENIKPTIVGAVNNSGLRIDMFQEFAFDLNDNDKTDDEGNYLHPYFFGKLRQFDGEYGFNLFDHAIDEDEMAISMTSGSCGGCKFIIGVDNENQKNLVQVDANGNLLRDEQGNVRCGREGMQKEEPQDQQNDTFNNEVWIALKKDQSSFGILMPNATNKYRPKAGDTFVILHIDLPKAYILSAEKELEESLIKFMSENNDEKFNFSITFSRIFFAENEAILKELNENARIQIEYDRELYELYISSYSYVMSNDKPLPEIRVELSDTLTISQNALQNAISEVKHDILSNIGNSQDFLKQGLRYFLRKDTDDRSAGLIASNKGFEVGKFIGGEFGAGGIFKMDKDGSSYLEVDKALFRKVAYFVEIVIKKLSHVGGQLVLSPASMRCSKVEEYEKYYRCYFERERDGKTINNEFKAGDQARAQSFNIKEGTNNNVGNQYYWRLVVGVGEDYIDLSKTDCDSGSLVPLVGDDIVQLGNRVDLERQNAIILSTVGEDAPSFKQYEGINYYTLAGKESTVISPKGNVITGDFVAKTGEKLEDIVENFGVKLDNVISQTDQLYTIWFFEHEPTLENLPASDWTDDSVRIEHLEDLFYDQESGRAYRFQQSIDGTFVWVEITDQETIKALEKAAKAQETADGKTQTFILQPVPPYNVGDRWVYATYKSSDGSISYDNDELVCIVAKKADESFSIKDWKLVAPISSADKKYFYSEFERTDNRIKSVVAEGVNRDEAIRLANAAAEAAMSKANEASGQAQTNATAIVQQSNSISLLAGAFELNNGEYVLKSSAGAIITSEVARMYATKQSVDSLTGRVTNAEAKFDLYVLETELGNLVSKIEISADQVNLSGAITYQMFSPTLAEKFENKADGGDLYALEQELNNSVASLNRTISSLQTEVDGKASVSSLNEKVTKLENELLDKADIDLTNAVVSGSTLIVGGYINSDLVEVDKLKATNSGYTYTIDANGFTIKDSSEITLAEFYASGGLTYLTMRKDGLYATMTNAGFSCSDSRYGGVSITATQISMNQAQINGFALTSSNTATPRDYGFIKTSNNIVLPKASTMDGRVIFVRKTSSSSTITSQSTIYSGSDGTFGGNMMSRIGSYIFVSDGVSWYAFNCYYSS